MKRFLLIAVQLCFAATGLAAQELSVLDANTTRYIYQEVSGDAAYEHIRHNTQFHRPRGGADGLWTVARYYETRAREYGLEDVQLIRQSAGSPPWNASFADLWITEPAPERIAGTIQSPLHLADFSRPTDVTGELIDVGAGRPEDLSGMDVAGKILLTYGSLNSVMRGGVVDGGALGVVWYPDPRAGANGITGAGGMARPDQLRWISVPSGNLGDGEPTFAFGLSMRQGVALSNRLAASQVPVMVHAVVESEFDSEQGTEPWQVMVEGFIRGTDPGSGQDVVLTGHMQEEGTSANDDASGTASVLEVARALNRLITEGHIPRPRRNLRFWWVTEISSERQYFADHPEAHIEMWVNVNQDMVGADQSLDMMRKQNVTRLPAARFHFFNDVVENVLEYVVASNNFELAQLQTGIAMYPNGHLAHRGSIHRYNAEMIYSHNNTDHMTFNEAPIGVPGVTFTNMPDRYIHSSDDDLWNVDATQLGRSAAAVALIAYTMASAEEEDVAILAAETIGRGSQRLGHNLRRGLTWIARADDDGRVSAYYDAVDQIEFATNREALALQSLTEIGAGVDVGPLLEELNRRKDQALRDVRTAYRQASANRNPPRRTVTNAERELEALTPVVTAGPAEFQSGRGRIGGVPGLHALMSFEVLNAANGDRNGLEIFRFVVAEAREAGPEYYGTVTPEAVLQYLQRVIDAGLAEAR